MKRFHNLLLALASVGAVACTTGAGMGEGGPDGTAQAELRDANGRVVARAMASDSAGRLQLRLEAAGLAAGTYGAHVHTVGRCDAPGFESAGPHWNPTSRQHGTQNPQGPHQGDLPNLSVGTNGVGTIEFGISGASVASMMDADGAAMMIHAGPDDYRTDPSGNSGARIACGVFG